MSDWYGLDNAQPKEGKAVYCHTREEMIVARARITELERQRDEARTSVETERRLKVKALADVERLQSKAYGRTEVKLRAEVERLRNAIAEIARLHGVVKTGPSQTNGMSEYVEERWKQVGELQAAIDAALTTE